jgi:hypothetical protein
VFLYETFALYEVVRSGNQRNLLLHDFLPRTRVVEVLAARDVPMDDEET